ncbi:hypothetical protein KHM83_16555 [Fusibacter paucivorans]|uniref:Four helix bundle sensory module for signal transduction n=1 Tax=Fusibacter paucivorans TaxID=76009 RepID=A0ABS5PVT3_9FIRM|nr:hypothetical protein [Fusibacter paucivorans]MBS7528302.1 hypothetical protein [Fusibacter paucivorans]
MKEKTLFQKKGDAATKKENAAAQMTNGDSVKMSKIKAKKEKSSKFKRKKSDKKPLNAKDGKRVSLKERLFKMTLFKKNMVGYLVNLLILLAMSAYIFTGISQLTALSLSMGTEYSPRVVAIMRIKQLTTQIHLDIEEIMADKAESDTMDAIKDYYKEIEFYLDALKDGGSKYDVTLVGLEDDAELAELRTSLESYYAFKNVLTQRYQNKFQNNAADSKEIETAFDDSFNTVLTSFTNLEAMMYTDMDVIRAETDAYAFRFKMTTLVVFLATIILSFLIGIFVTRNMTRPVKQINDLLIAIAVSDF